MNKKQINFIPITILPFKKDKAKNILGPIVNPYHIVTLKKDLDKVELKTRSITLIICTILE